MQLNHYEAAILVKNGKINNNSVKIQVSYWLLLIASNYFIKGFCKVLDGNIPYPIPTEEDVQTFREVRESEFQKQDEDAIIKKKLSELQYKNIKNVKRKKNKKKDLKKSQEEVGSISTNCQTNVNTGENNINVHITNEIREKNGLQSSNEQKNKCSVRQHGVVTIFGEDYWIKRDFKTVEISHSIESTLKEPKYLVYEDLWRRGFYVSVGSKFGGDFLAYPGKIQWYSRYTIMLFKSNE